MNLIALATLNAYITLELCALTAMAYHKANIMQLVSYKPLFKKLVDSVHVFFHQVFGLYCTVYDDVQSIDLELPVMSEIVSSYCVVHVQNNTLIECASFNRAKSVCDAMGLGYYVICKYWLDGQYVYDNQVYRTSQEVYMTLENMYKALHMLTMDDLDRYTLTNLISDITEGYLSYNHKPNKLYKIKVYIKAVSFYGYEDKPSFNYFLSMFVIRVITRLEIICIEMLCFYSHEDWLDKEYLSDMIFQHTSERYPIFGFDRNLDDLLYDDPMFDCLKVKPLFSMMVLQYLARFEILCIKALMFHAQMFNWFYDYEIINFNSIIYDYDKTELRLTPIFALTD